MFINFPLLANWYLQNVLCTLPIEGSKDYVLVPSVIIHELLNLLCVTIQWFNYCWPLMGIVRDPAIPPDVDALPRAHSFH